MKVRGTLTKAQLRPMFDMPFSGKKGRDVKECHVIWNDFMMNMIKQQLLLLSPQVACHKVSVTRFRSEGPHNSALCPLSRRTSNNWVLWRLIV